MFGHCKGQAVYITSWPPQTLQNPMLFLGGSPCSRPLGLPPPFPAPSPSVPFLTDPPSLRACSLSELLQLLDARLVCFVVHEAGTLWGRLCRCPCRVGFPARPPLPCLVPPVRRVPPRVPPPPRPPLSEGSAHHSLDTSSCWRGNFPRIPGILSPP